jgi:hypothetical protein
MVALALVHIYVVCALLCGAEHECDTVPMPGISDSGASTGLTSCGPPLQSWLKSNARSSRPSLLHSSVLQAQCVSGDPRLMSTMRMFNQHTAQEATHCARCSVQGIQLNCCPLYGSGLLPNRVILCIKVHARVLSYRPSRFHPSRLHPSYLSRRGCEVRSCPPTPSASSARKALVHIAMAEPSSRSEESRSSTSAGIPTCRHYQISN